MGTPPVNPPAAPENSKAVGVRKFHLSCIYHGALELADTLEQAHQAAAQHLQTAHPNVVAAQLPNAEVMIQEVLHYGIADVLALLEASAG